MGLTRRVCVIVAVLLLAAVWSPAAVSAWEGPPQAAFGDMGPETRGNIHPGAGPGFGPPLFSPPPSSPESVRDYLVKMAYGRTFGTCTELDYATIELSKRVSGSPLLTVCGPAWAELQMALLASYVFYYEGNVERLKRLNFRDGYEIGWLPKGRFTIPVGSGGLATYLESGAGMSYVTETYRNSGSRVNWSLLGGFGFERPMGGGGSLVFGVQWRHLSNGNMWGKGDELHNSNSGTDMIQGLATLFQKF